MGLWRQRLVEWWTVQEHPGVRQRTGVSSPEPPALLLTEGLGGDTWERRRPGSLGDALSSRAISEPRIGSQREHPGLGLCFFIFCCVDLEQAT